MLVVAAKAFSAIIAVKGFLPPPPLFAAEERSSGLLGPPPPYSSASWGSVEVDGGFGRPTWMQKEDCDCEKKFS